MTTVEKSRTTHTEPAEILPFFGPETTQTASVVDDLDTLFRFPAPDDPAPAPARLLGMAVYAAALGLAAIGVGLRAMLTVVGGAPFWYVPVLSFFGLLSVTLAVGSLLSIHRPTLPWMLLLGSTVPLSIIIAVAALY